MDQNQVPGNQQKKDTFYINLDQQALEAQNRKEKQIDSFFDRMEGSKKTKINDAPKRPEGQRYVTKDSDVMVFRSEDGKGYTYNKAKPEKVAGPTGDGPVPKKEVSKKEAKKNAGIRDVNGNSGSGGKKPPKPARKRSVAGRIFGALFRVILGIVCLVVIAGCVLAVVASVYLVNVTKNDDETLNLNNIELSYSTMLLYQKSDREYVVNKPEEETEEAETTAAETEGEDAEQTTEPGKEVSKDWFEYQRIYGKENRVWIKFNNIPQHIIDALVSSEDRRFWDHQGVDWKSTIKAFLNAYFPSLGLSSGTRGGSTLVQQLIKNITEETDTAGFDGALRKMREIYRAIVMEKNYSREQILESYLNTFRLSGQVAGIEAAANYYFNKTTGELSVAETASILCITKAPGANNPYSNPDENRIQRDTIINTMHSEGYLTDVEWKAAKTESEFMVFDKPTEVAAGTGTYDYFVDTVVDEVVTDFMKYQIGGREYSSWNDAFNAFANGGYRVQMTIDPFVQAVMEDIAINGREQEEDERRQYPRDEDGYIFPHYDSRAVLDSNKNYVLNEDGSKKMDDTQPQSAYVVMNMTGEIKGIIGGLDEKTDSLSFNRATKGTRSTGSSMKPLAAYGPALEADAINFSTLFPDMPLPPGTVPGVYGDWPRNYDRSYGVPVTVASGIARSLNTTAVYSLHQVGVDFSFDFMRSLLGLKTLNDPGDRTYSMALGGLYTGIAPVDMCAAFASFGNGGWYYSPHSYTRILDAQGNVVFDKSDYIDRFKAFGDDTAYIMNRLLYNVMHSGFSGTGVNACPPGEMDYVGKSGTHTDNMDFWFVGMNPYYTMAVWQGYDVQDEMESLRPHPVQLLFKKVMSTISEDLEVKDFPIPEEGVVQRRFCMATGLLATEACPDTRLGYYKDKEGGIPDPCDHSMAPNPEDPIYQWPRPEVPPAA